MLYETTTHRCPLGGECDSCCAMALEISPYQDDDEDAPEGWVCSVAILGFAAARQEDLRPRVYARQVTMVEED